MFSESPELYDAIYGAFKNYADESRLVAASVRQAHPPATTLLDAGCGTAEHAKHLTEQHAFKVDGFDLDEGLLAVARRKLPAAHFIQADMTDFSLNRRYDAVICMFSAIGYVRTLPRLVQTLRCFAAHLNPGGVVLVEPWFAPGVLREGPGMPHSVQIGDMQVLRNSNTRVVDRMSFVRFDYRIEQAGAVREVSELHELGVFTQEETLTCFENANLKAEFNADGPAGRGLYIARRRS